MSSIQYSQRDQMQDMIKNEIIFSDFNIYGNEYISLKEEKKSISDETNFQNFIKREFSKDSQSRLNLFDLEEDNSDFSRKFDISYFRPNPISNIFNNSFKSWHNFLFNFNLSNFYNDNNPINSINNSVQKKIFNIEKIPKKNYNCLERKSERGRKKKFLDWNNIIVPKEKHFHLDRKKHRIVFQRKHLKVIYSIVDLAYPFNFNKCFDMIKEHIGDKTLKTYKEGKSFHIIKINNEEKIVTLKDKKRLLKANKIVKKN